MLQLGRIGRRARRAAERANQHDGCSDEEEGSRRHASPLQHLQTLFSASIGGDGVRMRNPQKVLIQLDKIFFGEERRGLLRS